MQLHESVKKDSQQYALYLYSLNRELIIEDNENTIVSDFRITGEKDGNLIFEFRKSTYEEGSIYSTNTETVSGEIAPENFESFLETAKRMQESEKMDSPLATETKFLFHV